MAILPKERPDKLSDKSSFGPPWLDSLKQFNNVAWTLQIPLANHPDGNTKNSVEFFNGMLQAIGGIANLTAVEIGNEPDLYAGEVRPENYTVADYVQEWKEYADAISKDVLNGNEYGLEDWRFFQALTIAFNNVSNEWHV